jgi:hypothetical protein
MPGRVIKYKPGDDGADTAPELDEEDKRELDVIMGG